MKFLPKKFDSDILAQHLTYKRGQAENNRRLKEALMAEQNGFCAYTEKFLEPLDSVEVEHFDWTKKYNDDYFNYYAVLREANLYKQDQQFAGALFFESRFFQEVGELRRRIGYRPKGAIDFGEYYALDDSDTEANALIAFLGFNDPRLSRQRQSAIEYLKSTMIIANWGAHEMVDYLKKHRTLLSFPTAIEAEFGIDLTDIIENKGNDTLH
jgi:hypothetical protein